MAFELVYYDAAVMALAEAVSTDEIQQVRNSAEAFRAYARQAKDKQMLIGATELRFRAERRLGEMIAAQKETVGLGQPGVKPQLGSENELNRRATLAEAGIDKKLSSRAQKMAAIDDVSFDESLNIWRDKVEQENERVSINLLKTSPFIRGTFGTGENEWYTPNFYLDPVRKVIGGNIDLDPASSDRAQLNVLATNHFTEKDNGLEQDWFGNVWLNPPYAQPAISHFIDKTVNEWENGNLISAFVLTHNYTDTAWFQKLAQSAAAICFTRGRIRFVSPDGELASPTQGQAFFYLGSEKEKFSRVFSEIGFVAEVLK